MDKKPRTKPTIVPKTGTRLIKFLGGPMDGETIEIDIGLKSIEVPDTRPHGKPNFPAVRYDLRTMRFTNALGTIEFMAPVDIHNFHVLNQALNAYGPSDKPRIY